MTSPLKTIRLLCKDCSETVSEIRGCKLTHCAVHPYRMGRNRYRGKEKPATYKPPLKAIRSYCLDCCLDQPKEVRLCPAGDCAIHPFRFGRNPFVSEAKREAGQNAMQMMKNGRSIEDFQGIHTYKPQPIESGAIQKILGNL